jgi:broad specificity phosphatase PhoE
MISTNKHFRSCGAAAVTTGSFRMHRCGRVLLAVACLLSFVSRSEAGLKIYYIRHAEGGHNVVKEWAKVPKAQRPAYVGNGNVFTPKGEIQAVAAVEKLRKYHFDFIGVSSMWRTRNTILPYLKAAGAKGEIWPELHEFGGGSKILATNLPPPAGQVLNAGTRVELPPAEAPYFSLREDAQNNFKLPPAKEGVEGDKLESAIQFVVRRAADMIHKRFGGTDKTILLVGHGNSGRALLRMLTNDKLADIPAMLNTGIWMVEEQPNGQFTLEMYNDAPWGKDGAVSARP